MGDSREDIGIIVVTHKQSKMPKDSMYIPLQVGIKNTSNLGYQRDDKGENISELNCYLGTQTGLYWAWKNLDYKYIGLVHYRRFFTNQKIFRKKKEICFYAITYDQISHLLGQYAIFVPRKRRYYIETIESHYNHVHGYGQIDILRNVVKEKSPEYVPALERVLSRKWAYMFNMFIMEKDLLDNYCTWLFMILFELIDRIDVSEMSDFDKRFGGRLSERLFNVWLEYCIQNNDITRKDIKELPYIEDVNWKYKIVGFLKAKFLKMPYTRSS